MAAVTNEYNLGVPEEVLSDHFDYMDVDYAYSLGETCFRLEPRVGPPSGEQSCHLRNMNSMYSEEKYGEARDPPLLVGELQFPEVFEELSFSAVDVLIKRAGDNTYHVPVEMSCLREGIQLAADFFHSNNPDAARDFYCYVRPSTTAVPPQGCQRYKWIHADGLLGPKHRNADGSFNKKLSYNFTLFNRVFRAVGRRCAT